MTACLVIHCNIIIGSWWVHLMWPSRDCDVVQHGHLGCSEACKFCLVLPCNCGENKWSRNQSSGNRRAAIKGDAHMYNNYSIYPTTHRPSICATNDTTPLQSFRPRGHHSLIPKEKSRARTEKKDRERHVRRKKVVQNSSDQAQ